MFKNVNYTALAAVALIVSVPFLLDSTAQEGKAPAAVTGTTTAAPAPATAPDLNDPAFDRYVDLMLLGKAWNELDPALITDCALQLAEGERILMRSHKAVSSKQLLELAAKVAADKRDTATLDRLATVCNATKNTATLEQVTSARKLAGATRKVDPAMSVSAVDTSPDQLALYQEAINGSKAAGILGDSIYFENLEAGLADKTSVLVNLSEAQKNHLKKIMGEARDTMPKESAPGLAETLTKLKDASRQNVRHGIGSILHGIGDLQRGHHTGHGIGSIIHGINDLSGGRGHSGHFNQGHQGYYQQQYQRPYYGHNYGHNYQHQHYNPYRYGHNYGHSHGHHSHGWHP